MSRLVCFLVGVGLLLTTLAASAATDSDCLAAINAPKLSYLDAAARKVIEDNKCSARDVFCVDHTGFPVPGEVSDPDLRVGDKLSIVLLGPKDCGDLLQLRVSPRVHAKTLFPGLVVAAEQAAAEDPVVISKLDEFELTVDSDYDSVTLGVSQKGKADALVGVSLNVLHSTYLIDVGVLVPIAYPYREVNTQRIPGLKDTAIRSEYQLHASIAVAVNIFFLGQYSQPRLSGWHGLGLQAGVGGDLRRLGDELYLGGIYEIVPGAGVSMGLALLRMDGLQPDYPEGTIVDPNDVPKDNGLRGAMYFGFNLNTQVFQTVLSQGAKAHVSR